jgi:hypothetical protein
MTDLHSLTTMQEQYDEHRRAYLTGKITHSQFYLWLADAIDLGVGAVPFTIERIRRSNDEYLNDLPLHIWDRQDPIVRRKAARSGIKAWSLSDTVCVLKAIARREAGK